MMPTADQAIANAARLLERAEIELTNLPLMERLDELAASWLQLAALVMEKERV
ncbi:hypothetical protein [Streptomyces albipurpureus]|uniref:Uncharacterized protein n=1 Tax=Streptomyces albipurpureus TaxID=2897419 RepID=A0ABT0V0S6_9ACTN|nr:hypothetical protein [Streptomyces sp. CWNU-1]MCM2394350.1 hypothetical protein [Streptomyces sp. CWNU-1]